MPGAPVAVGLVGSQFISSIHAETLKHCAHAELVGVASPTPGNAARFAERWGIPRAFIDDRRLLDLSELQMLVVGAPCHRVLPLDAGRPKIRSVYAQMSSGVSSIS